MKRIVFTGGGTAGHVTPNIALFPKLKELGYDGRNRKSVKLKKTKPNVVYVAVTENHKPYIVSKKVLSFKDLAGEVVDPYGQSLEVYINAAKQIEKNVEVLLEKLEVLRGKV